MQRRSVDGINSPRSLESATPASFQIAPSPANEKTPVTIKPKFYHHHMVKKSAAFTLAIAIIGLTTISGLLIANQRPLKGAFTSASVGVESLMTGITNLLAQPGAAKASFDVGANSFEETAYQLQQLDSVSKSFLIFPYAREGVQLLRIGYHAALAGQALSDILAAGPQPPSDQSQDWQASVSQITTWLSSWPEQNKEKLETVLNNLSAMNELLVNLDVNKLPGNIRSLASEWKSKLPTMINQTTALANLVLESPNLFAGTSPTRYVILFQNNTELRPTGGFIGSYAGAEFNQGALTNFNVQTNVYKADKAFAAQHPIVPPYPISDATTVWGMRDANWDIDFRDTAKQVLSFYHGIYGHPAHGVIAIDTSVITDLLKITGPIDFPEYQTTLSADNFVDTVQYKVEIEYFDDPANKVTNEPKKLIADFIPKLSAAIKALPEDKKSEVWSVLAKAATRKSILAYTTDETAEQALLDLDAAGQVKATASDFLSINNANIGGGKSSANVSEQVAVVQKPLNGTIETTLKITRTHHGNGIWPDNDNSNYMRVVVPQGSTLVRYSGAFEWKQTEDKYGKTVFGGWFTTPVASKRYAEITYDLPTSISSNNYSLFLERQPGAEPTSFTFDSPLIKQTALSLDQDTLLGK